MLRRKLASFGASAAQGKSSSEPQQCWTSALAPAAPVLDSGCQAPAIRRQRRFGGPSASSLAPGATHQRVGANAARRRRQHCGSMRVRRRHQRHQRIAWPAPKPPAFLFFDEYQANAKRMIVRRGAERGFYASCTMLSLLDVSWQPWRRNLNFELRQERAILAFRFLAAWLRYVYT